MQSKYTSPDKKITPAQKIAEIIMERAIIAKGKTPPVRFWRLAAYKKDFVWQVILANRLLTRYSESAILRAVQSQAARTITSLANRRLIPLIEAEQHKLELMNSSLSNCEAEPLDTAEKQRETFVRSTSISSKLKGL